jgi:hypothetical protein
MKRYFLHLNFLRDYVIDPEGVELPDLEAAKTEARDTVRELAAHHLKVAKPFTLWSIRLCDDSGGLLAEVTAAEALNEVLTPIVHDFRGSDSHI